MSWLGGFVQKGPLTFRGGVHPPEMKTLAADKEIQVAELPAEVVIPLSQHIGAPCLATVEPGEKVLRGQPIGEPGGFVSAAIHASISGTVKAVEPWIHPLGGRVDSVIIESDGKDDPYLSIAPRSPEEIEALTSKQIVNIVQEAGIVGLGGAAFPTHVKLSPPANKKIELLILNGAECEPYLTCDYRVMLERTGDVLKGMILIMRALGVSHGMIGIEINKRTAGRKFQEAVEELCDGKDDIDIEVVPLQVKYPQGAEKNLIYAITGREVPSGGLPMDVGCVVQNVGTAAAVWEAVSQGKPLYERVVTIAGYGIKEARNLVFRVGTLFSHLVTQCGGFRGTPGKIISGGPMMGIAQCTTDFPLIKGTSGILVFPSEVISEEKEQPCVRCARCVDACPAYLLPTTVTRLVRKRRFDEAEEYGINDCVECGSCTFICPARIPLVQWIKHGKMEIRNAKSGN